jgi:hypothetical protein
MGRRLDAPPSPSSRVPSLAIPAVRAVRKEEDQQGYSRCQLRPISLRRTARRRLFSVEDANSPRTFSDLVEPSPNRSRSLTLSYVAWRHARTSSVSPDALLVIAPCGAIARVDLLAEGPPYTVPVRARCWKIRERLPSCPELASRNPQAERARTYYRFAHLRTVSPSLHPCPASGGASSFLPASALPSPRDLAASRRTRRAIRPTDFCHPNDWRAPIPRAFPARCHGFHRVDASWDLGPMRLDRRIERFHDARSALADREDTFCDFAPTGFPIACERGNVSSRGVLINDRASGIPVASRSSVPTARLRVHRGRERAAEIPVTALS